MADPAARFSIHEAKTQLSRIIDRVERGEEIVISRAGRPVAKVVPLPAQSRRRGRGTLAGKIRLAADWDQRRPTRRSLATSACRRDAGRRSAAGYPRPAVVAGGQP